MTANTQQMTKGQKRLLWVVYILGGFLGVMFFFTMGAIIWKLAS